MKRPAIGDESSLSGYCFSDRCLGKRGRRKDEGGELVVPRRILLMLERKYQSRLSIEELCEIVIKEYYKTDKSDK